MYKSLLTFTMAGVLTLASCDEGDIYPAGSMQAESGTCVIHLTGTLTGLATLPQGYSLVLAGFEEGADYATLQKAVGSDGDGHIDMTLTAQAGLTDFELCVTNGVRKRIVTLASVTAAGTGEVLFDIGHADVSGISIVQQAIFTPSCASCHGVASERNAYLCLTDGESERNLVGVASLRVAEAQRVQPGNASASVVHRVIDGNIPEVAMPHADILDAKKKGDLLELLDAWIKSL